MFKEIAEIMCHATENVIHPLCIDIHKSRPLTCRVGSGKATYHVNKTITYGVKMVESKLTESSARLWTTGKEIIKRKYFDEFNFQNIIIATILHEYAHYIQVISGGRHHRSVHNEEFYKILDGFYEKEYHFLLKDYLMKYDVYWNTEFNEEDTSQVIYNKENLKDAKYIKIKAKKNTSVVLKVLKLNSSKIIAINETGELVYNVSFYNVLETYTTRPEGFVESLLGHRKKVFSKGQINIGSTIILPINKEIQKCRVISKKNDKCVVQSQKNKFFYNVSYRFIADVL